jgi:hypothetical protein
VTTRPEPEPLDDRLLVRASGASRPLAEVWGRGSSHTTNWAREVERARRAGGAGPAVLTSTESRGREREVDRVDATADRASNQ